MTRRRWFVGIIAAAMGWLVVAGPAAAVSGRTPAEFVRALADKALSILRDNGTDVATRHAAYRRLLNEGFAIDIIARFAIGRYWRAATPAQRREYMTLFRDFVIAIYADRLDSYSGQTFKVVGTQRIDDKDTLVHTEVRQPNGPSVRVDYRVRAVDEGFKVIDVYVEGVSLLTTQRSEFAAVINRDGIDGLLELMRKRAKELKTVKS